MSRIEEPAGIRWGQAEARVEVRHWSKAELLEYCTRFLSRAHFIPTVLDHAAIAELVQRNMAADEAAEGTMQLPASRLRRFWHGDQGRG